MVDLPADHEQIYATVEQTNTQLVTEHFEHLEVIINALMLGISANLRLMSENEPAVLPELSEHMVQQFQDLMQYTIDVSNQDWQSRTLN
jgi:hypothetical protein